MYMNSPRMKRIRAQEEAASNRRSNLDFILAVAMLPWGYLALIVLTVGA